MTEQTVSFSAEDYALWKHHPVSKAFLQFARDYASVLEREALDRWRSGALKLTDEQEMRGRVLATRELAELEFASLAAFYEKEKES